MLNQAPREWTLGELSDHMRNGPAVQASPGAWLPARPYGAFSLRERLRLAWLVFTGRCDALRWPYEGPTAR